MNQQILRTSILSITENKNSPRIWQECKILDKANFKIGQPIRITYLEDSIKIVTDPNGDHKVSKKRDVPVIDINNKKILDVFTLSKKVQVIIRYGEIEIKKTYTDNKISQRLNDNSSASVFSGGGLLDEAVKKSGYESKWAIELNEDYANVWQSNHKGVMHNCSVSEIDYDLLEPVSLLTAGIPCEPFSKARQNQKDQPFHKNENLSMLILFVIKKTNPRTIILEEVPQYINSQIGMATIETLKQMGYNVECKMLKGTDYGELTVRNRVAIIATTPPNKPKFPKENPIDRTMKEILLSPEDPRCEWFTKETKSWIFKHWEEQKAKGNSFVSQQVTEETKQVQAITKRYFAGQGSNPVVKHPTKPNTFRWFTLLEVKRLMGLPDNYNLDKSKTLSGEILGQGILVNVFEKVIRENKQ